MAASGTGNRPPLSEHACRIGANTRINMRRPYAQRMAGVGTAGWFPSEGGCTLGGRPLSCPAAEVHLFAGLPSPSSDSVIAYRTNHGSDRPGRLLPGRATSRKGYRVFGVVRRSSTTPYERIAHILDKIEFVSADLLDQHSLVGRHGRPRSRTRSTISRRKASFRLPGLSPSLPASLRRSV